MLTFASDDADVVGLGALGPLDDVELDRLVLVEAAVAVGLDGGEVHEDIGTPVSLSDEAEALLGVEPLDSSLCHAG